MPFRRRKCIATEYAAKAAPDGYTLFAAESGQMVFNPGLSMRVRYNALTGL
jgi:hypothetical protein